MFKMKFHLQLLQVSFTALIFNMAGHNFSKIPFQLYSRSLAFGRANKTKNAFNNAG